MDSATDTGEEELELFIPVRQRPLEGAVWWNADLYGVRSFLCGLCKVVNSAIWAGSDIVFSIAVNVRFVLV